ncbi:hypothetical protein V5O48_008811 [Marasmius crinis-equi]|uniref:Uncharacterized protein n=1 Tax=Marasmius crinis-equi TaxID=585013 RepID=A0ABR3FCY5_9AGAR
MNQNIDPRLLQVDNIPWQKPVNAVQQQATPMYAAHTGPLGTSNGNPASSAGNAALIQSNSNQTDLLVRNEMLAMQKATAKSTPPPSSSSPPSSTISSSSAPAPASTTAGLDPHLALLTATMETRVVLNEDDYNVKFWDKPTSKTKKAKTVKVESASSNKNGPLEEATEEIDPAVEAYQRNSKGVQKFLQKPDGTLWDSSTKDAMLKDIRIYWNQYINPFDIPENFSSLKTLPLEHYRAFIESRYPDLRLCSHSWKADAIWCLNYHSWKNTAKGRLARAQPVVIASPSDTQDPPPAEVPKTVQSMKGKKRPVINISDSSDDDSSDDEKVMRPPLKKPKTAVEAKGKQPVNATLKNKKMALPAPSPLLGFKVNVAALEAEISTGSSPAGSSKSTKITSTATKAKRPTAHATIPTTAIPAKTATTATVTASATAVTSQSQLADDDLEVIKSFRTKVETLPKSTPTAGKDHILAAFNKPRAQLTTDIIEDEEVWPAWDPRLNALISQDIDELKPLVAKGKNGLIALVTLFEHLVHDRNVLAGMVAGKARRVIAAIDRFAPPAAATKTQAPAAVDKTKPHGSTKPKPLARWALPTGPVPETFAAQDFRAADKHGTKKEFQAWWEDIQQDRKGEQYKKYAKMAKDARDKLGSTEEKQEAAGPSE